MIITFVGHSLIPSGDQVKEAVKNNLRANIPPSEKLTCYVGGYGDFDRLCAIACRELKAEGINMEVLYVTPYLDSYARDKIAEMRSFGLCDGSVYPPIENTPARFAISARNKWMVSGSDLIIAYVKCSYGGAYSSLCVAKRRKKRIINIADL